MGVNQLGVNKMFKAEFKILTYFSEFYLNFAIILVQGKSLGVEEETIMIDENMCNKQKCEHVNLATTIRTTNETNVGMARKNKMQK